MNSFDLEFFNALNEFAGKSPISDWLIGAFARYVPYAVAALPTLIVFCRKRASTERYFTKLAVQLYAAGLVARFAVTPLIRNLWPVARPFAALPDAVRLIPHEASASFPSGHAAFFFALAASIWFYDRRFGAWFFAAAAVISIARIMAGVHWPSDVFAGAIIGIIVAHLGKVSFFKRK
ncbi:MAG: phosphatase PAP2 family protein [Candidatus Sungbacteria bacterium]|nr:phosphatase PAP2 family protein [Candidatus Sungbacteria bacterium]